MQQQRGLHHFQVKEGKATGFHPEIFPIQFSYVHTYGRGRISASRPEGADKKKKTILATKSMTKIRGERSGMEMNLLKIGSGGFVEILSSVALLEPP